MRKTLRRIRMALLASLCTAPVFAADPSASQRIADDIARLASDEFEGRAPGTRGEDLTVEYLVDQLRRAGVAPGNPDGSYLQNVPMVGYRSVPRIEIEAGGRRIPFAFLD